MERTGNSHSAKKTKATCIMLLAVVALLAVIGSHSIGASYDSLSKIPNPESGRWLGDASYWNGGADGWTFARCNNGDSITGSWISKGQRIDDDSWDVKESGASTFTYKVAEWYWSASVHDYCLSRVEGFPSGYAGGDVWDGTP